MKYSKLQWFVFAFLIPLIFAIILYIVVLFFLDKSFTDQMKAIGSSIPVVSKFVDANKSDETDRLENELVRLSGKLEEQTAEITLLTNELNEKDAQLKKSKEKVAKLEQQLRPAENDDTTTNESNAKNAAKLLLAMSPKDAALIIAEMNNEEAILLLTNFKPEETGRILAKLDPKRASELTNKLAEETE